MTPGAKKRIYPVILSGGSGTRLWPLSREHFPKQLLCLSGDKTLLQQTVERLDGLDDVADPLFVCNEEHRFLIAEQISELGQKALDIILEPAARNTCPAATVAALRVMRQEPNAVMLLMPADHLIENKNAFHQAIDIATKLAMTDRLVTFGVVPTHVETGFGYIRRTEDYQVVEFVEKPDAHTAATYLAVGDYLWNSGMFMVKAQSWLDEVARYSPDILKHCQTAFDQGTRDREFWRLHKSFFMACPSDSIDYAVMEKTDKAAVVPLDAGWSDVGAWSSLWDVSARDANGNVIRGDVCAHDTRNSLLFSEHRLVATVGLNDMIVIETPDAILVARKGEAQNVKTIVNRLKAANRSEYLQHHRVYRPWGYYESIDEGDRFQVKRLLVKPSCSLSLQMHYHRAEHWIVVRGTARVTRGEEVFTLTENQSTYIPVGTRHRLENPGTIPLEIIEVQSGSYLGEDDIVRYADNYNRHIVPEK